MGIDPVALLAGPRGRRVCLEVARRWAPTVPTEPDPLELGIFLASFERQECGAAVLYSTVASDGLQASEPTGSPAAPGLDELARMFAERPPEVPGSARLWEALAASVQAARYWQGPDGDDRLADEPELRAALAAAAGAVAAADDAAWWATGVDATEQWAVDFDADLDVGFDVDIDLDPAGGSVPRDAPARVTLARWRSSFDDHDAELRRHDEQNGPSARISSDWWSVPPFGLRRSTRGVAQRGAVGLHLVEDAYGWRRARLARVSVNASARVFEVTGPERWAELCARFPLDATFSRRGDWEQATARDGRWLIPDWPRVAEEYDGVHVSVLGYLSTAGRAVPVGDGWASVLAGWNPDETYWLTDSAVRFSGETADWTRGDGGEWRMRE